MRGDEEEAQGDCEAKAKAKERDTPMLLVLTPAITTTLR